MDKKSNINLAVITALAGVLSFSAGPIIIMNAMDAVLRGIDAKIKAGANPLIFSAPTIVTGFFPLWGGLSVAAGVALLLVAKALFQGEGWAKPAAIGLLALPAITGAYFTGPVIYFARSKIIYIVVLTLIGLIPYFILLMSEHSSWKEKTGRFLLFLMLGVTAAVSFANGGTALRIYWARPEPRYLLDQGNLGFLMGIPVVFIGLLCVVIGIPYLSAFKRAGYRLSLVGLMIIVVGSVILFLTNPGTVEFLLGIILAIVSLVLLWVPGIGGKTVRIDSVS